MRRWNPMFYGDLPYILGYATSGEQLRVVTIDRHLCAYTILECFSIFQHKEEVLKLFYNLPFFFQKMTTLSKMTCPCPLLPYTPYVNEKRKIELMDEMVQRTIDRVQCRDQEDFDRLTNIYVTLQALNDKGSGMTHLQTVRKLSITKRRLVVQLGPLGFERAPEDVTQAREWLLCILTALKYWHSCDYCHGDLRSQNIVYVPTGGSGYWVLIDMDESRLPNTTIIDWNHDFTGEKLRFQHDLYQLGKLLQTCTEGFTMPDNLVNLQTKLLSSVESPAFTAEVALTALQAG
jgi:serine/threonine protein kinase